MAALNVNKVFKFTQFVANKENRGWVSVPEFNIASEVAQLTLYSELEGAYKINKKIEALLRPFVRTIGNLSSGSNDLPADIRISLNAWVSDVEGHPVQYVKIKEVDIAELPEIYHSQIVAPSVDYPIYYIDWNESSKLSKAVILPDSFPYLVSISYIKIPTAPEWIDTGDGSRPIYDSANSVDFEFDETAFLEISMRVLSHIGINIGKEEVTQYALTNNKG